MTTLPRPLTCSEAIALGQEYAEFYNCEDHEGMATARAGGDDPEALKLIPGDLYSTLAYDTQHNRYEWNHETIVYAETSRHDDWKGDYYEQVECAPRNYFG